VAERTLPLPAPAVRWIVVPAFLGALTALLVSTAERIRRHARQPALPRMSDEWLRTHDLESGHRGEFWRERW
jgi:hypothetical protein